jgi:hypothetical protein
MKKTMTMMMMMMTMIDFWAPKDVNRGPDISTQNM